MDTARAPSIRSTTTDYFGRATSSRGPTDLTPHLSQAPEFRVPTHEAPQKVLTPRWSAPSPHQLHATWERDDQVSECRECRRRFTFLNRRVSHLLIYDISRLYADEFAHSMYVESLARAPRFSAHTSLSIVVAAGAYSVIAAPRIGHSSIPPISYTTPPSRRHHQLHPSNVSVSTATKRSLQQYQMGWQRHAQIPWRGYLSIKGD